MQLAAQLIVGDDLEQRRFERRPVDVDATLRLDHARRIDAIIDNLSLAGCRLSTTVPLEVGDQFWVGIAGLPLTEATVVRVDRDTGYACAFARPFSAIDWQAIGIDNVHLLSPGTGEKLDLSDDVVSAWTPRKKLLTIVSLAGLCWAIILAAAL